MLHFRTPCHGLLLATASCIGLALQAHAETMDYSTLEQMFGEPVTTSATGEPQRASDVPANMVIVTQDDIRRSGADNIPDILRYVTGVDVESSAAEGADVGIRGFNQAENPHLLVLIDGREVYLNDYGYVDWGALPVTLDSIRQIEVVKGPNSALFGFNAVSGVVNIITYDPLLDDANAVTAAGGTQTLREGYGVATIHPTKNLGIQVSSSIDKMREYSPEFLNVPGSVPVTLWPSAWHGFFAVNAKLRATDVLILGLAANVEDGVELETTPNGGLIDPATRTNSVRGTAEYESPIGSIAANAYHNELAFNAGTTAQWSNSLFVGQLSDTAKLNASNTIRAAVEYRSNDITGDGLIDGTLGYHNIGPSGMWSWQLLPSLNFTNAIRADFLALHRSGPELPDLGFTNATYDHQTITGISYNSGLVYKYSALDTFRLMASRGLQVPSLLDFGTQIAFFGGTLTGTPYVAPAVMTNYEIDYDRHIDLINGSAGVALYHELLDGIVSGPFDTPHNTAGNFGDAHQSGAEFTVKGLTRGIRYNLGYTIEQGADHSALEPANAAPLGPVNFARSTPTSVVTAGLGTSIEKWEFDGAIHYQTRIILLGGITGQAGTLETIPNYVSTQLRAGYRLLDHVTLAVSAQQALTPALQETTRQKVGRRIISSVTASF